MSIHIRAGILAILLLTSIIAVRSHQSCSFGKTIPVEKVFEVGSSLLGDSGITSTYPCWLNPELARVGQRFGRKYFGSIFLAHGFSLIALLSDAPTRKVLVLTKRSDTPERAFARYLATAQHVHLWYHQDLFSQPWQTSVGNIRKIHSNVSNTVDRLNEIDLNAEGTLSPGNNPAGFLPDQKMWKCVKEDTAFNNAIFGGPLPLESDFTTRPRFLLNQYTMSVTLWSFIALPVLNPKELGISRFSQRDLQGFTHLWTVIAYALGMEEEFIFCKDPVHAWQECLQYMRQLYKRYFAPQLRQIDFGGQVMIESLVRGLHKIVPPYPVDAVLIDFFEKHVGIRMTSLRRLRTAVTYIDGKIVSSGLRQVRRNSLVRWLTNIVTTGELQLASRKVFGDPGTNATVVALTHFYT